MIVKGDAAADTDVLFCFPLRWLMIQIGALKAVRSVRQMVSG